MPSPNKRKRRKSDEQGVVFRIAETHKVVDWDLTTIQANAAISHSGLEPHLKQIMEQPPLDPGLGPVWSSGTAEFPPHQAGEPGLGGLQTPFEKHQGERS